MSLLVSIIMPAYNAEAYISDAIMSVKSQTYTVWELIVVDDGSTENTASIVKGLMIGENRIKYIYQNNQGLSAARNTGIKNAKGFWIAFLDSDDLWMPEKLEKQLNVASTSTDLDIIYSTGYFFYGEDLNHLHNYPIFFGKHSGEEMYKLEQEENRIPMLSAIVRRSFIDKISWDVSLNACEDWDYWLRCSRAGANFFGMSEKLFYYRRHSSNLSGNLLLMQLSKATVLLKNFEKQRFTDLEVRMIFKPLIVPLLVALIKNEQIKEVKVLMEATRAKLPSLIYKISYSLFKIFKKYSIFPIRAVNRIDTLFAGI